MCLLAGFRLDPLRKLTTFSVPGAWAKGRDIDFVNSRYRNILTYLLTYKRQHKKGSRGVKENMNGRIRGSCPNFQIVVTPVDLAFSYFGIAFCWCNRVILQRWSTVPSCIHTFVDLSTSLQLTSSSCSHIAIKRCGCVWGMYLH